MDEEDKSKNFRIFKLDENNQYGFAKTKPLPIGVFKKEVHLDMDILKNYIKKFWSKFDENAKIGEILIFDIEFTAYYDSRKKCKTKFSLVFLNQRQKFQQIEGAFISYLLLCARVKKKKFQVTEKIHTTLCLKKDFSCTLHWSYTFFN